MDYVWAAKSEIRPVSANPQLDIIDCIGVLIAQIRIPDAGPCTRIPPGGGGVTRTLHMSGSTVADGTSLVSTVSSAQIAPRSGGASPLPHPLATPIARSTSGGSERGTNKHNSTSGAGIGLLI